MTFTRFQPEAGVTPEVFAEVTVAASVDGDDWVLLGTDDASSYGLFWDTSSLDDGTAVELTVTVDDLTGGRGMATLGFHPW